MANPNLLRINLQAYSSFFWPLSQLVAIHEYVVVIEDLWKIAISWARSKLRYIWKIILNKANFTNEAITPNL
jgi:hypothetical protein